MILQNPQRKKIETTLVENSVQKVRCIFLKKTSFDYPYGSTVSTVPMFFRLQFNDFMTLSQRAQK